MTEKIPKMALTQARFERIAHVFPKQRGNVSLSHLAVLNAILHVAEQGCKGSAGCRRASATAPSTPG